MFPCNHDTKTHRSSYTTRPPKNKKVPLIRILHGLHQHKISRIRKMYHKNKKATRFL